MATGYKVTVDSDGYIQSPEAEKAREFITALVKDKSMSDLMALIGAGSKSTEEVADEIIENMTSGSIGPAFPKGGHVTGSTVTFPGTRGEFVMPTSKTMPSKFSAGFTGIQGRNIDYIITDEYVTVEDWSLAKPESARRAAEERLAQYKGDPLAGCF